ncbi:MAG: Glycine/D-amino acid oxidases (deaminating) [uncultured Microvirga sp.]|uniref:Glycine/D-amino acid oxidases (Deaminating) n=1 Tax=uncultured Microvirga sp. TaxID=412392 RepID=A0A6J4LPD9_9HYPH|nr:MAG: Glycine/D-amino acid oxidases (deaminating) [uncultured Microvirga sp.]
MAETFDVVIAGGAAMGSSVAYHLLADPAFQGRVLVVEKDSTYRRSASALSAASIRQQFSSLVNIRISLHGIAFLRDIGERLAVDGERPEIGLTEGGYLYLASQAGAGILAENQALQRAEGADIVLLDQGGLATRFPWLSTGDLACGAWGRSGEGWFDGWALLQAFRRKARALGAVYRTGAVAGVERQGGRILAVTLDDGSRVGCGALVNCAGAGGRALAAQAGVDIPVFAKRRSVFSFTCGTPIEHGPLLIDTTGVWTRPEGEGFICGVSPGPGETDPDWIDDDPSTQDVDWAIFEERIWPALAHRVPAFEAIRPGRAWAGPYDMCALDHNAIIGLADGPSNLYLCNGFSGHGLQQSPTVGRGLAELIVHGRYVSLDLSALGFFRVAADAPLRERNVI